MQPDFWHDRWKHNEIGFHQDSINRYLRDHWSVLGLSGKETVLVPLCGKSRDMLWIAELGHPVIGIEISEIACRQFFAEAGLTPRMHPFQVSATVQHSAVLESTAQKPVAQKPVNSGLVEYVAEHQNSAIRLLCGDFFAVRPEHVKNLTAAYDRAALIAFPPEMRPQYIQHLYSILAPAAQVLLVTMEYPQEDMSGPPFSVTEEEVQRLCEGYFNVQQIHQQELGRDDPFAKRKGLSDLWEKVYVLKRC